jgi:flagellar biosynthetic protein FliP
MTTCSETPAKRPKNIKQNLIILATFIIGFAMMIFPYQVFAQELNVNLGTGGSLSARVVQLIGLMTVLSRPRSSASSSSCPCCGRRWDCSKARQMP